MKTFSVLTLFAAFALSTSSFAHDCRVIFDPGFSSEAQALIGGKYLLVDEEKVEDVRTVPFRIVVKEDLDIDPETLTFQVIFNGVTVIEEKHDSIGFYENVAKTEEWLKNLPSCNTLYRAKTRR